MVRNVPRYVWIATLVGVVLSLPTLFIGFYADDYNHLLMVHAGMDTGPSSPFDIYRFFDGNLHQMIHDGPMPWWTNPDLHIAFLRPIASAMFMLDHALFGLNAVGYHVHTVLWYAVLLVLVGLYYRRLFGDQHARVAALGAMIFAMDEAHGFPVAWIAARYAVVATVFMVLALWAHQRHREDGWRAGRIWGPLAFCASLAAGEAGLTTLMFLFGYELVGQKGAWRGRATAFAPYVAIGVAYLMLHRALGYGVNGSGLYVHPISSTARYLAVVPERLGLVMGSLFATLPVDAATLDERVTWLFGGLGIAMALVFAWLLRAALRRVEDEDLARTVRWLTAGALLTFIPTLGAPIGGRLTLYASVGMSPVFGFLIHHGWRWAKEAKGLQRLSWRAGTVWMVWQQLVLPAPATLGSHIGTREQTKRGQQYLQRMPVPVESKAHIVFLSVSDVFVGVYGMGPRFMEQGHLPASWHFMSLALKAHRVERTAERTLVLSVVDGHFLGVPLERVFRAGYPELGFEVETVVFTAKVVKVEHERPTHLSVTFKYPLEGDEMHLLYLAREGIQHLPVPPIGESIVLPAGPSPLDFEGPPSPAPELLPVPSATASASASASVEAPPPAPPKRRCPEGEVFVPATGEEGFVLGRHRVVLTKPFCMDATEVTVGAYEACVKAEACPLPRMWGVWINYPKKQKHPMNKVSWPQAKAFCSHHEKSLPTEAQWEWAARGGDGREWPWGDDEPTCEHADFTMGHLSGPSSDDGCHGGGTSEVGTHPKGDRVWPDGHIHDLAGNVWEWVIDNHAPYPGEDRTDPVVKTNEAGAHVVRGGGWNRSGRGITTHFRGAASVDYKVPGLGFRCVRNQ